MSFLRRLRRDKEEPAPAGQSKEGPKEEPTEDDVRVYSDDELRPTQNRRKPTPALPKGAEGPSPRSEPAAPSPASRSSTVAPAARSPPDATPVPAAPAPPAAAARTAPTAPAGSVTSPNSPPPLPERGPAHPPRADPSPAAASLCFVCRTPLEENHCPVCRMTWVE